MHIRKYDFDFARRAFLKKGLEGAAHAGLLTSLWPMLSKADTLDITKSYPDELLSIEAHTKGKVSPGDLITPDNLEHVEHLLDPIIASQVRDEGREIRIIESSKDISELFQDDFLEATLRNRGRAVWDKTGNVRTDDGTPWIGGNPFPDPQTAKEALVNVHLSWGRHDYSQYAIQNWNLGPDGDEQYYYDFVWVELNTTARADGTVWQGREDLLRYQSVWFVEPNEQAGTSFLSVWPYDQHEFPQLSGYIPAFKRVREYPTNQRFEPLVPGMNFFLSDAWHAGDPMLTWGNFKIVGRQPMLGPVKGNWNGSDPDWNPERLHGGPKGKTFWESKFELIPECLVIEAEPTGYPRAPVGKKRYWMDVRNQMGIAYNTYDRKGDMWKSVEGTFGRFEDYKDPSIVFKDANGHVSWSWQFVLSWDAQTKRMTRFKHSKEVGGYITRHNVEDEVDAYNKYLTRQAMRRLGA